MSLFPARMKKFQSKMKALEWSQHFCDCKSMGIFSDPQGQLTHQSMVGSGRFSNSLQDFIIVLITCKNEEVPIKNEGARVLTTLYIDFSDTQGQLTPQFVVVFGQISNSSVLLWLS